VKPGDLLLVKGSRSVKMERIVEAMLGRLHRWMRAGNRRRRTRMLYYLLYHMLQKYSAR